MGFDLYGEAATLEEGKYYRNNCWHWRPLWDLCFHLFPSVLSWEDHSKGQYNDGHFIDARKAGLLAVKIKQAVDSGRIDDYIDAYNERLGKIPLIPCVLCRKTGIRKDAVAAANNMTVCNGCNGGGWVKDSETWYRLTKENVIEFANFARLSGGFKIC